MSEAIKERIAKILALAERGGTQAEAETAMEMALELLTKHNLSMSDVQTESIEDEDIISVSNDADQIRMGSWQGQLWMAISQIYYCEVYQTTSRLLSGKAIRTYVVTGRRSNVETTQSITNYLITVAKEQAKAANQGAAYRNSFYTGFASAIYRRSREQQAKLERELKMLDGKPNMERALTLVKMKDQRASENREFLRSKGIKIGAARRARASAIDHSAYQDGHRLGSQVSLTASSTKRIG